MINNFPLPFLVSAARTVDTASVDSDDASFTPNAAATFGLIILVDITASGGAMLLSPRIQMQEPAGLVWVTVWQAAAPLVALGQAFYFVQHHSRAGDVVPNSALMNEIVNLPMFGTKFRFQMYHGNANSQTYSAGGYWLL